MTEHLRPEPSGALDPDPEEQEGLRVLSRSPHPYHHQSADLPHLSRRFTSRLQQPLSDNDDEHGPLSPTAYPPPAKDSPQTSDSGSEADDEHFLKGLPAPKAKLHKGLRGRNEVISGTATPVPSPSAPEELHAVSTDKLFPAQAIVAKPQRPVDVLRRYRVIVRRATEAGLVMSLGLMVASNPQVSPLLDVWGNDIKRVALLSVCLIAIYPLRVVASAYRGSTPSRPFPFALPTQFDPAPLLYPPAITLFVSLLVFAGNPADVLPNLILSISSLPPELIPRADPYATYDVVSWALTCLPLAWGLPKENLSDPQYQRLVDFKETAVLLHPLHQTLCAVLHHLTTTSLLTAELQLFSIALINALLLASSPQVQILKALLWGGGLGVLVLCGSVIKWGISLARVPKWRFRRVPATPRRPFWKSLAHVFSFRRLRNELLRPEYSEAIDDSPGSSSDDESGILKRPAKVRTFGPTFEATFEVESVPASPTAGDYAFANGNSFMRRHTLPYIDNVIKRNATHTPSGRRKRATSMSIRPYLKLTQSQATVRKWLYAGYVYVSIIGIVFVGIRAYIEKFALQGYEPIGWALGYLFGDLPWFRFQVVVANLERWICLQPRSLFPDEKVCHMGWVQHVRHDDFGLANTRLVLSAYWICILIVGLLIVFRLKDIYEVDTRRKVFHFMMVGMFLPTTYVDPTYAALALSLVLVIFLILDLLRASQLPPLSKPIASFLAPYVDGRDFRGPVVISHIFLLIGCAIPLWLALAAVPRTGTDCLAGWEVPTRDVSMVAGVICVGLGDAAASLIGRRYGHRKWLWGGGKSLEGSVAFAAAVFIGLAAASIWLRIGGWSVTGAPVGVLASARNAGACASLSSLTEAVLTGGNDNVIVPVVLWTCVKSLGV